MLKQYKIGGLKTLAVTRIELADMMVANCIDKSDDTSPKLVFSSNGQGIALASQSQDFMRVMRLADIIHADGMSVVFASSVLCDEKLPERVATTDFFHDAAERAVEQKLNFYFLGGDEETNKLAFENVKKIYPDLSIVGRRHGYFTRAEESRICADIRDSDTDVLWLGLGKPLQEEFAIRNKNNLKGVGWVKTCGGLFKFLAEKEKRAPQFMQDSGLEWLFRLSQNPKDMMHRSFVVNMIAAKILIQRTNRGETIEQKNAPILE